MKIVKLSVSNFLKLKDIEMNPSHTNVIVGKNKQGKTSVLKAIKAALTGDWDTSSIRVGETKAEITLELDQLTVKRTLTEKGSYLNISNKEGMTMPSPQKYLDGIVGNFAFNPIEFFEKKPVERKKYLLNAIQLKLTQDELTQYLGQRLDGIDYNGHALEVCEAARKFYYDQRTIANAEVSKKQKSLSDLLEKLPEGFDPKSVSEEQISALSSAIQKDELERQRATDHSSKILLMQEQETSLKNQILSLTQQLEQVQGGIAEALAVKFDYSDDVATAAAKETLKVLEGQRELRFAAERAEEVKAELNIAKIEADKLDTFVKKLTKDIPADLISKAKLPVDGLSISGDSILVNGIDIDNMSTSEQLKFGLEIVRALNGEFKVICVDGIEALDKESFEFFLNEVAQDDFQYFVTRVEGNGEHAITIEDGEIKA